MSQAARVAIGSLAHHGAALAPPDLEEVDWLVLAGPPCLTGSAWPVEAAFQKLAPLLYLHPHLRVVASIGGGDPRRAARRAATRFAACGSRDLPVAVTRGHNLLPALEGLARRGHGLAHPVTGVRLIDEAPGPERVFAAAPQGVLLQALRRGARLLVTSWAHTADCVAAACAASFGWGADHPGCSAVAAGFDERAAARVAEPPATPPADPTQAGAWWLEVRDDVGDPPWSPPAGAPDSAEAAVVSPAGHRAHLWLTSASDAGAERVEAVCAWLEASLAHPGSGARLEGRRAWAPQGEPPVAAARLTLCAEGRPPLLEAIGKCRQAAALAGLGSADGGVEVSWRAGPARTVRRVLLPSDELDWSVDLRVAWKWLQ